MRDCESFKEERRRHSTTSGRGFAAIAADRRGANESMTEQNGKGGAGSRRCSKSVPPSPPHRQTDVPLNGYN